MKKKLLFLFFALLFPVTIFLFLKFFGRNEFNVPFFYQEGDIAAPSGCEFHYRAPYQVADTLMARLAGNSRDSLHVLVFDASQQTALKRITTEFGDDAVQIVAVTPERAGMDLSRLRDCVFLMERTTSTTLVDHKGRIRGYYDASDRDEVDRLIVEMKIILKKY